jgi:MoaA/NifB/PqqE/SkfB family radical SAM enzyme
VKRTDKRVDEILQSKKEELQEVAYEALKDFLFDRIKINLVSYPYHGRDNIVLCEAITEDINEKIDLFLVAEGYNNGEKNESNT